MCTKKLPPWKGEGCAPQNTPLLGKEGLGVVDFQR